MIRRREAKVYPSESLGDGWVLSRNWQRTWISFTIYRDRGDGFHDGHYATFCRKRDALAYMASVRSALTTAETQGNAAGERLSELHGKEWRAERDAALAKAVQS